MKTLKAFLCLFFLGFASILSMQTGTLVDLSEKSEYEKDLEKIFSTIHPDLNKINFNKITPKEKEKIKERIRRFKLKELQSKLEKK